MGQILARLTRFLREYAVSHTEEYRLAMGVPDPTPRRVVAPYSGPDLLSGLPDLVLGHVLVLLPLATSAPALAVALGSGERGRFARGANDARSRELFGLSAREATVYLDEQGWLDDPSFKVSTRFFAGQTLLLSVCTMPPEYFDDAKPVILDNMRALLAYGADPDACPNGVNFLHMVSSVAAHGFYEEGPEMAKLLIAAGADALKPNPLGVVPLAFVFSVLSMIAQAAENVDPTFRQVTIPVGGNGRATMSDGLDRAAILACCKIGLELVAKYPPLDRGLPGDVVSAAMKALFTEHERAWVKALKKEPTQTGSFCDVTKRILQALEVRDAMGCPQANVQLLQYVVGFHTFFQDMFELTPDDPRYRAPT